MRPFGLVQVECGDAGDLYPGTRGDTVLSGDTCPHSDRDDGSDSTIALREIMLSGDNAVADLSFGATAEGSLGMRATGSDGPLSIRQGEALAIPRR